MSEKVIVIGGGGHAKVVIDTVLASGAEVTGILDDSLKIGSKVLNFSVIGKVSDALSFNDSSFIIAIGSNSVRKKISQELNVKWYTAIHPSACGSAFSQIGEGSVVMPHAVINAGAKIGSHCIINTSSVIEHDNRISDFVHLSPRVALGGTVSIGELTHVGIGSTVKNNISICASCIIGAGAVVVKNIEESAVYVGVPAHKM